MNREQSLQTSGNNQTIVGPEWVQLLAASAAIFDRNILFYFPDPDARLTIVLQLMAMVSSIREFAIASADDLNGLWRELRETPMLLDFIISTTGDIFLETPWEVHDVADKLAKHILIVHYKGDDVAVDEAYLDSLGDENTLARLLKHNPWLITLCLLRRSGRLSLVRPVTKTTAVEEAV